MRAPWGRAGSIASSLLLFFLVSVLAGVLVAGLALPIAGLAAAGTRAGAQAVTDLPLELSIVQGSCKAGLPETSIVKMKDGSELAQFYYEGLDRRYVKLSEISPNMINAQLSIEDHRFYQHGAVDLAATVRAFLGNTIDGGVTSGGSSLTQQLVKLLLVESAVAKESGKAIAENKSIDEAKLREDVKKATETDLVRKITEMRYAVALEKRCSKDQILELYLNTAYYGDRAYGVEAAARRYFGVRAKDLSIAQAAMLAGLVQNPTRYNPSEYPDRALVRREEVLTRMASEDAPRRISKAEFNTAMKQKWDPKKRNPPRNGCISSRYPSVCLYVENAVLNNPALGKTAGERRRQLLQDGLRIETQIDPKMQDAAQKAIAKVGGKGIKPTDEVIGTMAMIQPGTGIIYALAQSRPVMGNNEAKGESNLNYNAGIGSEGYQAGSTFKIFAAAAALDVGLSMNQKYEGPPLIKFPASTDWKGCAGYRQAYNVPNQNRSKNYGLITLAQAMQSSVNTYFVQLERAAGLCNTAKMAEKAGIELTGKESFEQMGNYPSFVLGSPEVTPLSVANAYATFAARGIRCDPRILQKLTGRDGKNYPVPDGNCRQTIRPEVADGVNAIMQTVMVSGSGQGAQFSPAGRSMVDRLAGKTGTIDRAQAVWFAGYTTNVAGAAMIAVDKKKGWRTIAGKRTSGGLRLDGSGQRDAGGGIWRPAMREATKQLAAAGIWPERFKAPTSEMKNGKRVAMPPVCSITDANEARRLLEAAGFNVIERPIPDPAPAGTFLRANPCSGQLPLGATVTLEFADGTKPTPPPAPPTPGGPTPSAPSAKPPEPPEPPRGRPKFPPWPGWPKPPRRR